MKLLQSYAPPPEKSRTIEIEEEQYSKSKSPARAEVPLTPILKAKQRAATNERESLGVNFVNVGEKVALSRTASENAIKKEVAFEKRKKSTGSKDPTESATLEASRQSA